jgi:hypothetical protein
LYVLCISIILVEKEKEKYMHCVYRTTQLFVESAVCSTIVAHAYCVLPVWCPFAAFYCSLVL